ncbi:MAG: class II fructose-bisphosphate aldolase family protein [Eubacteriales bacterium]|nr:class II fructose-bisphosphate aldolase family protein [Eubacteriales bacterium]
MNLTTYTELLKYGQEHHITIGAFNVFNKETAQAIIAAANKVEAPVIMQTYHAHVDYAGADYMYAICSTAARHAKVKVALGLDHGRSYDQAELCINTGYTGAMIDLASSDYDVNVAQTRRVVELAHSKGVSVEAEIGEIVTADSTLEKIASGYTDVDVARKFVKETGVDCLAVSIGTAHGMYKFTPHINFDLLRELIKEVGCPIVVHGGSNTPDEDILKMVEMGISKLNVGTDFFNADYKAIAKTMSEDNGSMDIVKALESGRQAVEKVAVAKLKMLTAYRK